MALFSYVSIGLLFLFIEHLKRVRAVKISWVIKNAEKNSHGIISRQ